MFAGGEANEDLWRNVVVPGWQGHVLRGERVRRDYDWGTVVGTTDLVLADAEGSWDTIIELKAVCSTNTAIYRHLAGEPDLKHVVQSAVYMWLTKKPVVLCYTSRSDFAVEFARKKWGVTKVEPFHRLFYLSVIGGVVHYRDEYEVRTVPTAVTLSGIEDYYKMLAAMPATRDLGPRPSNDNIHGETAAWDRCDTKYCPFSEACDRYETDHDTWTDAVRNVCTY